MTCYYTKSNATELIIGALVRIPRLCPSHVEKSISHCQNWKEEELSSNFYGSGCLSRCGLQTDAPSVHLLCRPEQCKMCTSTKRTPSATQFHHQSRKKAVGWILDLMSYEIHTLIDYCIVTLETGVEVSFLLNLILRGLVKGLPAA